MRPSSLKHAAWLASFAGAVMASGGCARGHPQTAAQPRDSVAAAAVVRDAALEQRAARLQLRAYESDAQIEDLQGQLDDARQEVVRAMAKLQTLASRAEAASGIAEAEIAVQGVQQASPQGGGDQFTQARKLLTQSSAEFDKSNYGGALYLANQAKSVAGAARGRGDQATSLRPGEQPFELPLHLQTTSKANVREGPGTDAKVVYTLDPGAEITAYSYLDTWVRVADDAGRSGWVFYTLVGKKP